MAEPGLILVTGAGGGVGGVGGKVVALLRQRGRPVRAMAHHDDDRADALRALGADISCGVPRGVHRAANGPVRQVRYSSEVRNVSRHSQLG
jgi:NADPH:quinone reductase-like Zn-dependent oxidoreductase